MSTSAIVFIVAIVLLVIEFSRGIQVSDRDPEGYFIVFLTIVAFVTGFCTIFPSA